MAKIKGTTGAILSLLEVQTALEVSADIGKPIDSAKARQLAEQIQAARDLLQRAILAATKILEDGADD